MNASLQENPQWGVRWCGFVQGADQKLEFCLGHSLLSIFARTGLAFCAALPWKTQAEQSQPKIRRNSTFPVSSLRPDSFWNLHLQKFYSYREEIRNIIFYYCNVSFSTNSAFCKQSGIESLCASDPLKAENLYFAVELQSQCELQGLEKPFGKLFGKVFTLVEYLKPVFVAIMLARFSNSWLKSPVLF